MATDLHQLFNPRSVAIVGASGDANKVGGRPLAFLRHGGWKGRILPVNPSASEVQGIPAFASLEAIDEPVEQAIIALPAAQVPAAAQQCIDRGVRALQIFSSDIGEGAAADQARARLAQLAQRHGVRILGPNSLGLFNTAQGFFGTFATALDGAWPRAGPIGVATQSGAFGSYFFGMAQARGLGFSHFVATGNELDVDVADCVQFLAEDAATRLIVIALEGCKDGRRLAAALRQAHAAGKPVLAMKVGVSAAGAQAAATHTGSIAGEDRVFDAVLRDCGAWRARGLQELVDAAYVASTGPLPAGRRLLVVTTSGGIGVLCADAAEPAGLQLPPVGAGAAAAIQAIAPLAAGLNPVDTSAGILGDLSAYSRIAEAALRDHPYDMVLCYLAHVPRNPVHWQQLREPLLALRRRHAGKAFAVVALADDAIRAELESERISVFTDPGQAVHALAACVRRTALDPQAPSQPVMPTLDGPLATEADAKRALAACGIAFAPERLVRDVDEAAAAGRAIGYPVVLKIVSPDIVHKTEVGGVRLAIPSEAALRDAIAAMHAEVLVRQPGARIAGFLVARQLQGGVEVLVGTHRDPVFGPVVTVGAGGVLAELIDDACVRLAPVDAASASDMIASTRVGKLLRGFRGAVPANEEALAHQVALLSQIAWTNRDHIVSIDLNPVLALTDGAYAVDAFVQTSGDPR